MNAARFLRPGTLMVLALLFPIALVAQIFEPHLLNKDPLYATASVLQDYDNDGDLDIIVTRRSATTKPSPPQSS
jgi:hypothetical protein